MGFHWVAKTEKYRNPKPQQEKRCSPVTKHASCLELITQAITNLIPLRFVVRTPHQTH